MTRLRSISFVFTSALLCASLPLSAQDPENVGDPAPLFRSHEPLQLRFEADFKKILDDRSQDSEEGPAEMFIIHADGTEESFPLQIRTRGKFRLESNTCRFPPIRLNFPTSQMEGSIFEGQDRLKLVTHCRDSERYQQNLIKEYLVYRIYNELTPLSLQVRMAHITYIDTSGEEDPVEAYGFMIEAEEAFADRIGGEIMPDSVQIQGIHPARIRTEHAYRVALFQYMVGNTDFSMYGNSRTGSPPHNSVPVVREVGGIIPVPYDFDWTGLVNAPYARPDPGLGTRNVRQRVFRGLCRPDAVFPALYAEFQSHREAIMALVADEPLLGEDEREDTIEYLEDFWEVLENERNARRRIEEACRPI